MPADLFTSPRAFPEQLGFPIPDDAHAVSVCLPTWSDIVRYEENDESIVKQLQTVYPRFGLHPAVKQLCDERINHDDQLGLPFPSVAVAERAAKYCEQRANVVARVVPLTSSSSTLTAVTVAKNDFPTLKEYWQHAGENLSSRAAEAMLAGRWVTFTETNCRSVVRRRVSEIQQTATDNVFLFPSGMAAIATAFRIVQQTKPGPTCQFGFPYVDTLKIQTKFDPAECLFLPLGGDSDLQTLDDTCKKSNISAVFCEVPTNPLLVTVDLHRLRQLADQHDFLLVTDDTLAMCGNINTLPLSDITVTSLTKYFSGTGNVIAGSLTVNPHGRYSAALHKQLAASFEETLCDNDVEVLEANSSDLKHRMQATNKNAYQLAEFLRQQDLVDSVFYPAKHDSNYSRLQNPKAGFGGLMSIVLKNPKQTTALFYDTLKVNKGPNLGTRFTLCCPFTMLAHYNELDFAESCGVSPWLLRISVGLEEPDELIRRFADALNAVKAV